jgi:hypothetical protein
MEVAENWRGRSGVLYKKHTARFYWLLSDFVGNVGDVDVGYGSVEATRLVAFGCVHRH